MFKAGRSTFRCDTDKSIAFGDMCKKHINRMMTKWAKKFAKAAG